MSRLERILMTQTNDTETATDVERFYDLLERLTEAVEKIAEELSRGN
jgi:hypothetical protein